jgi:hypothetical protein
MNWRHPYGRFRSKERESRRRRSFHLIQPPLAHCRMETRLDQQLDCRLQQAFATSGYLQGVRRIFARGTVIANEVAPQVGLVLWESPPGLPGCKQPRSSVCAVRSEPLRCVASGPAISGVTGTGAPTANGTASSTGSMWARRGS